MWLMFCNNTKLLFRKTKSSKNFTKPSWSLKMSLKITKIMQICLLVRGLKLINSSKMSNKSELHYCLMCGSCHFDRALNVEISIEYWMIFVFLICCETHFGAYLRYRKGWVISFLNNSSFFFDQGVNKKVNKHSKFGTNFKIWHPVQITWSTH